MTGAAVASSPAIASSFFGTLWTGVGIGAAATPVGWVIAAGVVSAGTLYGVTRLFKGATNERVSVIPKFINTPLDNLGVGLFDLLAPLAIRLAIIDGEFSEQERDVIHGYFVREWGYDPDFVTAGIHFVESNISDQSVKNLAIALAEFKKSNPDCNYTAMCKEITRFLTQISEADGFIDEREEMAIERVMQVFDEVGAINFGKIAKDGTRAVTHTTVKTAGAFKQGVVGLGSGVAAVGRNAKGLLGRITRLTKKNQ
jgi:hypothetical protein